MVVHTFQERFTIPKTPVAGASVKFSELRHQRFSEHPEERNSCEVKSGLEGNFGRGLIHAPFSGIPFRLTILKTGYKTFKLISPLMRSAKGIEE